MVHLQHGVVALVLLDRLVLPVRTATRLDLDLVVLRVEAAPLASPSHDSVEEIQHEEAGKEVSEAQVRHLGRATHSAGRTTLSELTVDISVGLLAFACFRLTAARELITSSIVLPLMAPILEEKVVVPIVLLRFLPFLVALLGLAAVHMEASIVVVVLSRA